MNSHDNSFLLTDAWELVPEEACDSEKWSHPNFRCKRTYDSRFKEFMNKFSSYRFFYLFLISSCIVFSCSSSYLMLKVGLHLIKVHTECCSFLSCLAAHLTLARKQSVWFCHFLSYGVCALLRISSSSHYKIPKQSSQHFYIPRLQFLFFIFLS